MRRWDEISFLFDKLQFWQEACRYCPSVNDDPASPHIAELRIHWWIIVIVKSARFCDDQVLRLAILPGVQQAHRIDLDTQIVLRMRIRFHIVTSRIVVHEQHARAERHGQFLRAHAS